MEPRPVERRLLSNVTAPAYVSTLELLAQQGIPRETALSIWPHGRIGRLWDPLARQLYKTAFGPGGPAVFPSSDRWLKAHACEFADPSLLSLTTVSEHLKTLINCTSDGIVWLTADVNNSALNYARAEIEARFLSAEDGVLRVLESATRLWQNSRLKPHLDAFLVFLLKLVGRPSFVFDTSNKLVTKRVREKISATCCIPNGSGGLSMPSMLLHPKCQAAGLYSRSPVSRDAAIFPRRDLCSEDCVLNALSSLGLRNDLTGAELVERAGSVANLSDAQSQDIRIRNLLRYLAGTLSPAKSYAIQRLPSIAFLPVKNRNRLQCPPDLFRERCRDLVCCHHDVLDETGFSFTDLDNVLREIGVKESVSCDLAWQQLQSLAKGYSTFPGLPYATMCEAVYQHLSQFPKAIETLTSRLREQQNLRVVFHPNGGFLLPQQASLDCEDTELPPHLFTLRYLQNPDQCAPFLHALGVADTFTAKSYTQALARIAQQSGNAPVSNTTMRSCVQLLGCLIDCLNTDDEYEPSSDEIFAPDKCGVLRPCSELCYNNLPWLSQLEPMPGLYFANKCLSFGICERLGVPTQREQTLRQICEPFGQSENLTTRLEGILRGYPLGIELFKELIQNADDAEATEVVFVNDKRKLPTNQVLSDSWHELQGPALLAFSNSVFTDADFKGIQSLGVGAKRSEAWKTGRFGIGFNCVYNVTDVPQFISNGDTFCVLDPHCKYTHLAGTSVPGAKYSLTPKHKEMFKDALEGFLPGHLKQTGSTIFRLPLRTSDQAATSEICRSTITSATISSLFAEFRKEIASTLLFLTNIRRVSLIEVQPNGAITKICVVNARASTSIGNFAAFNASCRSSGMALKQPGALLTGLTCNTIAYILEIKEENSSARDYRAAFITEKWMVAQCVNMPQSTAPPKELAEKLAAGNWPILPKVGVAAQICPEGANTELCRVFSLLPLPIRTKLPAHVNGCFALDPSRRALWSGHSEDAETQWNDLLTGEILPHCYATMLSAIKEQPELTIDRYCKLLPEVGEDETSFWTKLAKRFYQLLLSGEWALLPCQSDDQSNVLWLPLAKLDNSVDGKSCFLIGTLSIDERTVLIRLGIPLIVESLKYLNSQFYHISREKRRYIPLLTPSVLADYLRGPLCADLRRGLPLPVGKTAFKNYIAVACLIKFLTNSTPTTSEAAEQMMQLLSGTPLNLTADNMLDVLSNEKSVYLTSWKLFHGPIAQRLFAHQAVLDCLTRHPDLNLDGIAIASGLFKPFKIFDFSILLAKFYPQLICTRDILIPNQNTDGKALTSDKWLDNIWSFISQEPKEELSRLSNAALVPIKMDYDDASRGVTTSLATVSLVSCVLCVSQVELLSNLNQTLLATLAELSCPIVNSNNYYLRRLCGSVDQPNTMICVIRNATLNKSLRSNQAIIILKYSQENWQSLLSAKKAEELCSVVMQLPIFVTIDDHCVSVFDKTVYILSTELAAAETHLWKCDRSTVLLRQSTDLKDLYKYLRFSNLDQWQAYAEFILPAFSKFSNKTKFAHICALQKKFSAVPPDSELTAKQNLVVAILKSTKIVFSGNAWHLASAFYDSSVEIFKYLLSEEKFLPAKFDEPKWRNLFIHAGLICHCSEDLLLKFAANIAADGLTDCDQILRKKSGAIVSYVRSFGVYLSEMCLGWLADISFIVSDELNELQELAKGKKKQPKMIRLRDSVRFSSRFLCWTASTVCPEYVEQISKYFDKLAVPQVPTPEDFEKHLNCLLSSSSFWTKLNSETSLKLRKSIMEKIYVHVGGYLKQFNSLNILKCAPFVLVADGEYLLPAKCICLVKSTEIPPYILSCPSELLKFSEVFEKFGATREIVLSQVYYALQCVMEKSNSDDSILGNDELDVISRCLVVMANLLNREEQFPPKNNHLYLTTNSKLEEKSFFIRNVKDLIINDAPDYRKRIGSHGDLQLLDIEFAHLDSDKTKLITNYLHKKQGVPALTDIVSERLADNCQSCSIDGCSIGQSVKNKLTNSCLFNGMIRSLLHSDSQGLFKSETCGEKLKSAFEKLSVKCMQELLSVVSIEDKVLPDSQQEKRAFLAGSTIYVSHMETDNNSDSITLWYKELSTVMNSLLSNVLGYSVDIRSYFQTSLPLNDLSLIDEELNKDNVAICTYGSEISEARASRESFLGSLVPAMLRSQLQELTSFQRDQLLQFQPNEIVALRKTSGDDDDSETFVYARVIARSNTVSSNSWLQEYTIQIGGQDTVNIAALGLFNIRQQRESLTDIQLGQSTDADAEIQQELSQLLHQGRALTADSDSRLALRRIVQYCSPDRHSIAPVLGVGSARSLSFVEKMHNYVNTQMARLGAKFVREMLPQWQRDAADIGTAGHVLLEPNSLSMSSAVSSSRKRPIRDNFCAEFSPPCKIYRPAGSGTCIASATVSPSREVALRYWRIASNDQRAGSNDIGSARHPAANWAAYKAHQAAEKALKAAVLASGKAAMKSHRLDDNLSLIDNQGLQRRLSVLSGALVRSQRFVDCRYPDGRSDPCDIGSDNAKDALEASKSILAEIDSYLRELGFSQQELN